MPHVRKSRKHDVTTAGATASAVSGLLAAAAALGIGQLAAAVTGPDSSPVVAVGSAAIDLTPPWLKDFAVATFGSSDKLVLLTGIVVLLALIAVAIGLLARRRLAYGLAGIAAFGALGLAAAVTRPMAGPLDALPSVIGAAAGMATLALLIHLTPHDPKRPYAEEERESQGRGEGALAPAATSAGEAGTGRRGFLAASAGAAVLAAVSGGLGQVLQAGAGAARTAIRLPRAVSPAGALPAGAELHVPGITPFVTPPRDFYRVDTALVLPRVDPHAWTLRIHGLVGRPVELSFDDLLKLPLVERYITLTCVSNQVGGPYAGTGRWLGVRLSDLLRRAGIRSGADQILSRSTDGFTAGTPVATVMDGRDALLAVGLDGAPLSTARGFPARLVVPGLYGFVSATKWVTDLKITRFADDRAYWAKRGWALEAPIKTMSRIDVPKPLARLNAGDVTVAGVAWAQHRGIARVEVRVDDGPWNAAELAAVPSADTWRQWRYRWSARPGRHTLTVRATDRTGAVQTPERVPPIPNGASGWQSIVVTVA